MRHRCPKLRPQTQRRAPFSVLCPARLEASGSSRAVLCAQASRAPARLEHVCRAGDFRTASSSCRGDRVTRLLRDRIDWSSELRCVQRQVGGPVERQRLQREHSRVERAFRAQAMARRQHTDAEVLIHAVPSQWQHQAFAPHARAAVVVIGRAALRCRTASCPFGLTSSCFGAC